MVSGVKKEEAGLAVFLSSWDEQCSVIGDQEAQSEVSSLKRVA